MAGGCLKHWAAAERYLTHTDSATNMIPGSVENSKTT